MIKHLVQIATHLANNRAKLPVAYVAGKVTGLPYGEVYAKFKLKQLELEADGYFVINPCEFIPPPGLDSWGDEMKIAVILLSVSQTICLLPDWQESKGAKLEFELAQAIGLAVMHSN